MLCRFCFISFLWYRVFSFGLCLICSCLSFFFCLSLLEVFGFVVVRVWFRDCFFCFGVVFGALFRYWFEGGYLRRGLYCFLLLILYMRFCFVWSTDELCHCFFLFGSPLKEGWPG